MQINNYKEKELENTSILHLTSLWNLQQRDQNVQLHRCGHNLPSAVFKTPKKFWSFCLNFTKLWIGFCCRIDSFITHNDNLICGVYDLVLFADEVWVFLQLYSSRVLIRSRQYGLVFSVKFSFLCCVSDAVEIFLCVQVEKGCKLVVDVLQCGLFSNCTGSTTCLCLCVCFDFICLYG